MELGRHEFFVGHFAGTLHIIIPQQNSPSVWREQNISADYF
jgi:hypothetical protein